MMIMMMITIIVITVHNNDQRMYCTNTFCMLVSEREV